MSCSIMVLSTRNIDSFPCLVVTTENSRILFDIGEGTQRLCVEHGVKLVKVSHVFITKFSIDSIGGLPGLCLTIADAGKGFVKVHGPDKIRRFMQSTRSFMKVPENFEFVTGNLQPASFSCDGLSIHSIPLSSRNETTCTHISYLIQTDIQKGKFDVGKAIELGVPKGPLFGLLKNGESVTLTDGTVVHPDQVLGPSEPGMYAAIICDMQDYENQLLEDISNNNFIARFYQGQDLHSSIKCIYHLSPEHVVSSPIYQTWLSRFLPSVCHITVNSDCKESSFHAATHYSHKLSLLSPHLFAKMPLFQDDASCSLKQQSVTYSEVLPAQSNIVPISASPLMCFQMLPIKSAGLQTRDTRVDMGQILAEFSRDVQKMSEDTAQSSLGSLRHTVETVRAAVNEMTDETMSSKVELSQQQQQMLGLGLSGSYCLRANANNNLIFLGTGCAVPSKYRNVSGILLQLTSKYSSMLLDAGEGTWLQLMRLAACKPHLFVSNNAVDNTHPHCGEKTEYYTALHENVSLRIAKQLKVVWISHSHADHHLGLLSVIRNRKRLLLLDSVEMFNPIVVVAPASVLLFLEENAMLDDELQNAYIPVSCPQLDPDEAASQYSSLSREQTAKMKDNVVFATTTFASMGLTKVYNVKVVHCSQSYGLIVQSGGLNGFKLVYSGDTRPCARLVEHGRDATILIHEATFEDDKWDEAVSKKHSTIGEALDVATDMNAYRVILTHFSQRYPTMPSIATATIGNDADNTKKEGSILSNFSSHYVRKFQMNTGNTTNYVVAFDFMHVSFKDLLWAPVVTDVLKEVFPPQSSLSVVEDSNNAAEASDALNSTTLLCGVISGFQKQNKSGGNKKRKINGSYDRPDPHDSITSTVNTCTCCVDNKLYRTTDSCTVHASSEILK